jgi:predicted phage baseplate assembly protein
MVLQAPNLDDRTYSDILAEARALIPRYAPEWTNHNESDPGITMLQLFAWMTDITLYRLNRVPERNYIKFLQMLGIELEPGLAATTELTFTLARSSIDSVIVPKGTLVASAQPDQDGNPIVFETDEALVALGAQLASVQVFDGIGYTLNSNANLALDQSFAPFGVYGRPTSALLLGFDTPLAMTAEQINLAIVLAELGDDEPVQCTVDATTLALPAELVWEYWEGAQWERLSVDKDETNAFAQSGHVYLRGPGKQAIKAIIGQEPMAYYWLRCRLVQNFYERTPQIVRIQTNTIRATQAQTQRDEVLGGSNGRPNQSFFVSRLPIVPLDNPATLVSADKSLITLRHIQLDVSERPAIGSASTFEVWQEVDDFAASKSDNSHFTLNRATGEIRFGDGTRGRIPVANPDRPNSSVVARLYRSGGGSSGNVGADILTNIQSFVPDVASVTNLFAASGGSEAETVDAAKLRAQALIKSRNRAVTQEDYEYFASSVPGVARALAQPLRHPKFVGAPIPGVVTVVIVPESDDDDPQPLPNQRTMQAVCQCLNERRLVTAELFVVPPTYREIKVEVEIVVNRQHDLAAVKQAVEKVLATYFHPLRGGELGVGWDFGRTVFFSKVYQQILNVAGVDRIQNNQLVIFLDGVAQPFCRDVSLNDGELTVSGKHIVQTTY